MPQNSNAQGLRPDLALRDAVILDLLIEALARDFGFCVETGLDDLAEYRVVHLQLDNGCKFLLMRYRGSPIDMLDIHIPAGRSDYHRCLDDVLKELGAEKSDVVEWEGEYERF